MTDGCVMQATRRIAPWQDGQSRGSTAKIWCRSAAVGPSPSSGHRNLSHTKVGAIKRSSAALANGREVQRRLGGRQPLASTVQRV